MGISSSYGITSKYIYEDDTLFFVSPHNKFFRSLFLYLCPHPLSASFVTFENICQKMKVGRKLLFPPTRISIFAIFVHTSMILN